MISGKNYFKNKAAKSNSKIKGNLGSVHTKTKIKLIEAKPHAGQGSYALPPGDSMIQSKIVSDIMSESDKTYKNTNTTLFTKVMNQ